MNTISLVAGHFKSCPVHKISSGDSNKFVLLCEKGQVPFVSVVEIFDVDGQTPPNEHAEAYEYFYVLAGEGEASMDDLTISIQPGSYFIVPPGHTHQVRNTGSERLYVLTTMIPDENFSDLILSGPEAELDQEDLRVLNHTLK
ncbi:MAG: cupin [Paenibacillus sp. RIFOXYA1_FULL_44_5]|nr:MAG: cupin [Paenibacillus sp. RIFOXYA1_FULL_44_5]